MKNKVFASIVFCLLLPAVSSSQVKNDVKITEPASKKIKIDFFADKEIGNVLVMISDTLGTTICMDSQDRFTGNYSLTFDLSKQKNGTYLVEVSRDEKYYSTKYFLK